MGTIATIALFAACAVLGMLAGHRFFVAVVRSRLEGTGH